MGGVWERNIRTARDVLTAILKKQVLDDERLDTIFAEVTNIVNSRPLTFVSDDVRDPKPLTPNDLLLPRQPGFPSPPGKFGKADAYGRRWRYVQYVMDHFWKRWTSEYLPNLQVRSKWLEKQRNLQIGDIVLVLDESLLRAHWPLGRVMQVFPGSDGLVRTVELKTAYANSLMRPINKLCLLEAVDQEINEHKPMD